MYCRTFAAYAAFRRARGNDFKPVQFQQELIYPEYPCPRHTDLYRKVAVFPSGFRELALSGKLSLQCIRYIDLVLQLSEEESYDILSLPLGRAPRNTTTIDSRATNRVDIKFIYSTDLL
jgi:hypothetical protein